VRKELISEIGKRGKLKHKNKFCVAWYSISSVAQDSSLVRRNLVSIGNTNYIPTDSSLHNRKRESFLEIIICVVYNFKKRYRIFRTKSAEFKCAAL